MSTESGSPEASNNFSINNINMKDILSINLQNKYTNKDSNPYYVFVEHLQTNFGRLCPIKIGYFLSNYEKIKISVGVTTIKVICNSYEVANSLTNHDLIKRNS